LGTLSLFRIYILKDHQLEFLEEQIVKGCKRFDRSAQRDLYELYRSRLNVLVKRYIIDSDDAKDVLQESFLLVFKNITQFKNEGSLEGWIKRIVINTSLQFLKKQKKNRDNISINEYDIEDNDNDPFENNYSIDKCDEASLSNGIDLVKQANIQEKELLEIIQSLGVDFRQVFNLFYIDNYNHSEIAKMLGIEEVTSRTRLARAKKKVQAELYKRCVEKVTV